MSIDELRKSVGYLRDIIGIEPPRKEESKEEIEESLLSLLQIDPNSYSDRILGGDEVEFDYELKKAKRLAKDIKRKRPAYRMKKRHMVSIGRHNFLRDNAIAIVEGRIDSLGEAEEYFAMQHLIDTDSYKELSDSERRCVILYAQMGDEVTPSQKMVDEGLVVLPVTEELYHKAQDKLFQLIAPDQVDSLLDDLLGENENPIYENQSPIYQELKQIKERIEVLMEKL